MMKWQQTLNVAAQVESLRVTQTLTCPHLQLSTTHQDKPEYQG